MPIPTYRVLDQYRENSEWADEIGKRYHFPKKYFKLLTQPNTCFLYHEPKKKGKGEYFGYGQIKAVSPDPQNPKQSFAEIINYVPFVKPVSDATPEGHHREVGPYYNPQNAVRQLTGSL